MAIALGSYKLRRPGLKVDVVTIKIRSFLKKRELRCTPTDDEAGNNDEAQLPSSRLACAITNKFHPDAWMIDAFRRDCDSAFGGWTPWLMRACVWSPEQIAQAQASREQHLLSSSVGTYK